MTPHDRWLEPDDEPDAEVCRLCNGTGLLDEDEEPHGDCTDCEGTGEIILTDAERWQKAFDDFDPPDNDYGEPL